MFIADFTERLAAHLNVTTVVSMDARDQLRLSDAVNAGLQDFLGKAPVYLKRGLIAGLLPAPRTVSMLLTAGSREIGTYVVEDADVYQTVLAGSFRNIIVPGNLLLYPWEGETGTYEVQICGDAVVWGTGEALIENLSGTPLLNDRTPLRHREDLPIDELGLGTPKEYREEHYGQTLGGRPYWCLRVSPLPDVAYRLSVRAQITSWLITPAYLSSATTRLPVEDRLIPRFIVPFALYHLTSHRLWKLPETIRTITQQYQLALADLENLPRVQHVPANTVGTPCGY